MINNELNKKARLTDSELRTLTYSPNEQELAMAEDYEKLVKQFAELRTNGAPKQVIMDALGLTEDDFSKLASREEVKEKVTEAEVQRAKNSATFDSNWDMVENLALKSVARELQINPDPDYALRAAAVANKAVRRRREEAKLAAQNALGYQQQVNTNNIAILNLSKTFIQQLQAETSESAKRQIEIQNEAIANQKLHDSVDVSIVKDAFGMREFSSQNSTSSLMPDVNGKLVKADKSDYEVVANQFEEWLNE